MFLASLVGLADLFLGMACKSQFMYASTFFIICFGYLQSILSLTRFKKAYDIALSIIFLAGFAYCLNMRNIYGTYCADYSIMAAQLLLLSINSLISSSRPRVEE